MTSVFEIVRKSLNSHNPKIIAAGGGVIEVSDCSGL
jgi:hypothetical protein